ncbi:MAG: helix-turn-helix domain-containing protein [Microcoleaceae cyanobacterium]
MEFANITIKKGEKLTLKTLIEGAGYSIEGFATLLGLTGDTIYKWNSGKSNMPLPTFAKVAEILQVDPWQLLDSLGYDMTKIPRSTKTETETITTYMVAKAPEECLSIN